MTQKMTTEDIDYMVENAHDIQFHHFEGTTTIVCLLTLENGFSIVGSAACINMEDFDVDLGEETALGEAKEKIWELEGYRRKVSAL